MERKFRFSEGEYYHIYNRGVDKRDIFLDEQDRKRFQRLLRLTNGTKRVVFSRVRGLPLANLDVGERIVSIGAYVLMPNHFHILARETKENGISTFMEKLSTAYTMYFNKKYARSGSLFQGTFKAKHVGFDEYLRYLYAYIHLNPVKTVDAGWGDQRVEDKKRAEEFLKTYSYSSYLDYSGTVREESEILSTTDFPGYFLEGMTFEQYLKEWLDPPELT